MKFLLNDANTKKNVTDDQIILEARPPVELVQELKNLNPYLHDQSIANFMRITLDRIGMSQAMLPSDLNHAAEIFLKCLQNEQMLTRL